MDTLIDNSRCLASLAVFRELYDNEKDVYAVISEFLKETIKSNGKHQFSLAEITQLLNENYDFNIPEAVIKTALKRIENIHKDKGYYIVDTTQESIQNNKVEKKNVDTKNNNNIIINLLFQYIQDQKKIELTEIQKKNIINSLCSFMLDESIEDEFSEYISAFIVNCQENSDLSKQLNTIKEGVVLYTGLKYNSNLNNIGRWDTELNIFIETEILFHFAGYNGILYQALFDDFFKFVKEINSDSINKTGKKKIHLKYFQEVKEEIERFFKKAEAIVNGKETLNPSKTAMVSIVDGCLSASDVISKKAIFYGLLQTNGIIVDDYSEYYSQKNHQYNIEDKETLERLTTSYNNYSLDISENLKFLNYVNIRRGGISNVSFETIGTILLSGNSTTIQIAWDDMIKLNGNVPLATTLSFLTNKFWFRLGKGFGENCYPKTFDIITKAQIILSAQLNNSVSEKFNLLQNKLKKGELNKEQAVATIVELRRQAKKPEEIETNDLTEILDCISEDNIETYIEEQNYLNIQNQKQREENEDLKTQLTATNQVINEQASKLEKYSRELLHITNKELKHDFFKKRLEYQKRRREYVNKHLHKKCHSVVKGILFYVIFILIAIILEVITLLFKDTNNKCINIVSVCLFLFPVILAFINHKKVLNYLRYICCKKIRYRANKSIIHGLIQVYNEKDNPPTLQLKREID